ncbi:hypothetical protein ROHU_035214 [Labeo rohita]|uniref:Uncharacterized protein n=1 Tax=Labeo rohita TaxID=84645 RepID=A0A498L289_LABRO|nr:hypothetical protein ROHU_035214 [Labeo rohita]
MLLRQCGNVEKGSCRSGRCCGSVEIQGRLLWERTLLRQCGNTGKAPAGADTTAAVRKYRETPAGVDTTAAVWKYREGYMAAIIF